MAKLSPYINNEIRTLYAKGVKQPVIAKLHGVSQSTISRVINRRRWREPDDPYPDIVHKGYERKRGKFQVRFSQGGYRTTIGVFDTPEEAHSVYASILEQTRNI